MSDFKTYTITPEEKPEIISTIKSYLERHNEIVFAYIFGLFVDPEMPFYRDIDVGIYVKDYKESDWWRYEVELSIELDKQLKYKYPVDLNVINRADILFNELSPL